MKLEDLRKLATSSHSQSFVSIEAWELLALLDVVGAAQHVVRISSQSNLMALNEALKRLEAIDG